MYIDIIRVLLTLFNVDKSCLETYQNLFINGSGKQNSKILWISELAKALGIRFAIHKLKGSAEICMVKEEDCTYDVDSLRLPKIDSNLKKIPEITMAVLKQRHTLRDLTVASEGRGIEEGDIIPIDISLAFCIFAYTNIELMLQNRIVLLDGNVLCSNILGRYIPSNVKYSLNVDECKTVCASFNQSFLRYGKKVKNHKMSTEASNFKMINYSTKAAFMMIMLGHNGKMLSDKFSRFYKKCRLIPSTILSGAKKTGSKDEIYASLRDNEKLKKIFGDWTVLYLAEVERMTKIRMKDSIQTVLRQMGMGIKKDEDAISTIICLCDIFDSPESAKVLTQIYKLTLDKDFNGVIWTEESLMILDRLVTESTKYKLDNHSSDLFNQLEMIKTESNLDSLISKVARLKGLVGEIIAIEQIAKTAREHYVDENEKLTVRGYVEQKVDTIKTDKLDSLLEINVADTNNKEHVVDLLVARFPNINHMIDKTPDFCRIEKRADGDYLVIYEMSWRTSSKDRMAKKITDEGKWEAFILAVGSFLRVDVEVITLDDESVAEYVKFHGDKKIGSAIAKQFLMLYGKIVKTRTRTDRLVELENEQDQVRIHRQNAVKNPNLHIDEDSTKRNFLETIKAVDNTNPSGLLFPPGIHKQMWIHMKLNSGHVSHYHKDTVMACCSEANRDRPGYLNFMGTEMPDLDDVYKEFREKMKGLRYKKVCKPSPTLMTVNTISLSHKEMNSHLAMCECFSDERQIDMKETISHLIRIQNPGGKTRDDPVIKMKDKISKLLIRLMYTGSEVELASKSGMLIKCGSDTKEIRNELVGIYKDMTATSLRGMGVEEEQISNIIATEDSIDEKSEPNEDLDKQVIEESTKIKDKVSEILGHVRKFKEKFPEQSTNLEPTKMEGTFFGFIEKTLRYMSEGIRPCFHNRVVICKSKCRTIRDKFGKLLGKDMKGHTVINNRMSRSSKDDRIDFILDDDISMERLVSFFECSSVSVGSFEIKMKERLGNYLDARSKEQDSKISEANIEWLIKCLLGNKYFCISLVRSIIAETLSKAVQQKKGLTIRSLTHDFNLYSDTVNYESDQIVFLIENRWTGFMSEPMKFDIKKLNAMELETCFLISLISGSLEQRNLFGVGNTSKVNFSNCDEWITFMRDKFRYIQQAYMMGEAKDMVNAVAEIRQKKIDMSKTMTEEMRVQELISYFSYFIGPYISENSKSGNSVLQMCRYFYSYNFSIRMNIKDLIKKLCVPVRGFASQMMVSVATACYFYNLRTNSVLNANGKRPKKYSEKYVVKGMIDFFSNMDDVKDSLQFCNTIYYVHAADRMEMDPRSPIDAYNMFCEKVGSWKSHTKAATDRLCVECTSELIHGEFSKIDETTKECEKIVENWKKNNKDPDKVGEGIRQSVLMSKIHKTIGSCCEDTWIELECLYGYQLFRRRNNDHAKEILSKKMRILNDENAKFTFYSWELLNEAGFFTAQSLGEGEVSKLIEKVGEVQINEMASTTNTKVSFPDGYNPIKASEIVNKNAADKVTKSLSSTYKQMEKTLRKEGKTFDAVSITAEIMKGMSCESQLDTTIMEYISRSVRRSFVDLDKNADRYDLFSFSQLCEQPRVMSVFMKEVYAKLRKSESDGKSASRLMKTLRENHAKDAARIKEEYKCLTNHDFFKALRTELKREGSNVNKMRDEFNKIVMGSNAAITVMGGEVMHLNGRDEGPSDESAEAFSTLFIDLTNLNLIRSKNQNMVMKKEYTDLYNRFIALREKHESELLKCFCKLIAKSMGQCIRWFVSRKIHSSLDSYGMEADAYVGPKVSELTPMEWFVLNMADKDYDMSVMFEMEPKTLDQLYQLKRIGVTTDQEITYGDFVRTMDIATHSNVSFFENHKKKTTRDQRIVSVRSDKAINAVLDICQNKGISSLMELCKLIVEDQKIHMQAGLAGKQQFGPIRDLGILSIDIRPLQYYVERCSSEILTMMPNDMMNNIHRKKAFLDKVVKYYREMEASQKYNSYCVNGDNSSWGPKHQNTAFLTCLSPLMRKDKTLDMMFTNFCLKAMHKKIYISDMIATRCENSLINNGLKWVNTGEKFEIIDRTGKFLKKSDLVEGYNIPKEMADVIIDQLAIGKCYFETDSHMIQGICHKQSSLLHCCVQAYFTMLINDCYKEDVTITMICSSDDYGIAYRFDGDNSDYDFEIEDIERLRNIYMLCCNIANSPKTIISRCHLGEIYSFFVTPITALQPTIKQSCAIISSQVMPTPLDECYLTFELTRMLFCSGGSVLASNVGLLCRYLRNCSVKGVSFSKSYDSLGSGNGFIPFINIPRVISMSEILGGLETTYCDRLRELISKEKESLSEGEKMELSCFAESSKISLYDDMSTRVKQISKTETIFGNPVKFKATEAMMKLRRELRGQFLSSDENFLLESFIKDIISENQPAYDLESTINKLAQAFMSDSIIFNLVGTSSRDIKSFTRMCHGGYYWESTNFLSGPKMFFSGKTYMSVSNINSWKVVDIDMTLEECKKSTDMIMRRVSSGSKLLMEVKTHIEGMNGDYVIKDEVKMTKRLFRKDATTKFVQNSIDDIVCYMLDGRITVEQGSNIKLEHIQTDLRMLAKIDNNLRSVVDACVEIDGNGRKIISKENSIKIKKLVSSLRSSRNPSMDVVMQVSSNTSFDYVQMLTMNKIMLNRCYELSASNLPVVSRMTDNLRTIYSHFTVLNNLDPTVYDVQKSWRKILDKSDLIQLMNNEIIEHNSDVEHKATVGRLTRLIGILNSGGESRNIRSEGIRTTVVNRQSDIKLIDRFSIISGDKSGKTEKFLIVTIHEKTIETATNEINATGVANLIRAYCARNATEIRIGRPRDAGEFFRWHNKTTTPLKRYDVLLKFSMNDLYPATGDKEMIKISNEDIDTSNLGTENFSDITSDALAIMQNRKLGLQIGYIDYMQHELDRLELLNMSLRDKGFDEVADAVSRSSEGEFRGEITVRDLDEISIDELNEVMVNVVRKDRLDIKREYLIPSNTNRVVRVPTMNDALILGKTMDLIKVDRTSEGIETTLSLNKGMFYASFSSRLKKITECVRGRVVRKGAIGIVTAFAEGTLTKARESVRVLNEVDVMLDNGTDANFQNLISRMNPTRNRIHSGTSRIYYKSHHQVGLEIDTNSFHLKVLEPKNSKKVENTRLAVKETISKHKELKLTCYKSQGWINLLGPAENIDWAEVLVLGIGATREKCTMLNEVTTFFSGLTEELPAPTSNKGLSRNIYDYGFSDGDFESDDDEDDEEKIADEKQNFFKLKAYFMTMDGLDDEFINTQIKEALENDETMMTYLEATSQLIDQDRYEIELRKLEDMDYDAFVSDNVREDIIVEKYDEENDDDDDVYRDTENKYYELRNDDHDGDGDDEDDYDSDLYI